jgi:hypothetical protein
MYQHPRKKVVRFELRDNNGPSKDIAPQSCVAVLECGHAHNLGISSHRPKRMACSQCPGGREVMNRR